MRMRVARIGSRISQDWGKAAEKEIKRAIENTKKPVLKEFEQVVADWEHKPKFIAARVGHSIQVRPAGRDAKIYRFVNDGTRPHKIRPRNKPFLSFVTGGPGSYIPKTKPVGQFGGPGIVQGGTRVYAQEVDHPGNKPRNFDSRIANKMAPVLAKAIRDAIQRVFERTGRGQ